MVEVVPNILLLHPNYCIQLLYYCTREPLLPPYGGGMRSGGGLPFPTGMGVSRTLQRQQGSWDSCSALAVRSRKPVNHSEKSIQSPRGGGRTPETMQWERHRALQPRGQLEILFGRITAAQSQMVCWVGVTCHKTQKSRDWRFGG